MYTSGATVVPAKAKTRQDNTQKSHNLLKKKLLSLEAQRISNILENCISQIEIAAALPALLRVNSVSNFMDEELNRALHRHKLLNERLETLEALKEESEGEDGETRKRERARIEKDIKDSVRDVLRLFRTRPDAVSGLRTELGMEVEENVFKMITGLKMFHRLIIERLLIGVHEEPQLVSPKPTYLPPVYDLGMVPQEEEIASAMKKIDTKISEKKLEIKHLQDSLQLYRTQEANMLQLADKQTQPHIKTSKKQDSLQKEIDQLTLQLNNVMLENREAERKLQDKNEGVRTETEDLLQKFDCEIEEKQADLELNEIKYEGEEEELKKLEKIFTVLEVEYNKIQEKRQLEEEMRQIEMKELELKTKAAIMAQAWWRGYSTRKALKNKGKNKKAKKGKGKKK